MATPFHLATELALPYIIVASVAIFSPLDYELVEGKESPLQAGTHVACSMVVTIHSRAHWGQLDPEVAMHRHQVVNGFLGSTVAYKVDSDKYSQNSAESQFRSSHKCF